MDGLGKMGLQCPWPSGLPWMEGPRREIVKAFRKAEVGTSFGGTGPCGGTSHAQNNVILLRKGNGVCSKSFSPTCLLWKPREVRVRSPAQKQTRATHSHTPSIQPNNFILQTHNPSFVWTAVSKQPRTQRPSQTSPSAEMGEGNVGLPGKLGAQIGAVLRNFQKH